LEDEDEGKDVRTAAKKKNANPANGEQKSMDDADKNKVNRQPLERPEKTEKTNNDAREKDGLKGRITAEIED